jgi:hypothetical protein
MLVIVGHGPGILKGLGSWLDTQTVVRLKWAERPDVENWGSRTDYVCGSTPDFWLGREQRKLPKLDAEYWWLSEPNRYGKGTVVGRRASSDWYDYWRPFQKVKNPKPSTGLRAIFCAIEFLKPPEIGLLGFDRILHPEIPTAKWYQGPGYQYAHDAAGELRCIQSLGVKIVEV